MMSGGSYGMKGISIIFSLSCRELPIKAVRNVDLYLFWVVEARSAILGSKRYWLGANLSE